MAEVDLPAAFFGAAGGFARLVLDLADGILYLALDLLSLAFDFHLGVAKGLAGFLLDAANGFLGGTGDAILVHRNLLASRNGVRDRTSLSHSMFLAISL